MNRSIPTRAATLVAAAAVLATACGSNSTADGEADRGALADNPAVVAPPAGTAMGDQDSAIPVTIPEPIYHGSIAPFGEDVVIAREGGGFGSLTVMWDAIDPATGEVIARIEAGPGETAPVATAFVENDKGLPNILASEIWRPRGKRGAADFTLTWYEGDMHAPEELEMPIDTRIHGIANSYAVTDDGKYWIAFDDAFYGPRVVDLETKQQTSQLPLVGCGPWVWTVGHDIYSVCEESREVVHLSIDEDGVISEVERTQVFPEGWVNSRQGPFASEAKTGMIINPYEEAYLIDVADGIPTAPIEPIGSAHQDGHRMNAQALSADASRAAVAYDVGDLHPSSARAEGVFGNVIVYDTTAGFAPIATLTPQAIGIDSIGGMSFSTDGRTLWVIGKGPEVDGSTPTLLVGFDAATAAKTSSIEVTGAAGSLGTLIVPQQVK